MGFYEKLSYSIGNEDWKTEQQALKITPDCRVVSITASGDRPLNLLSQNFKELITIDANPTQNHLLWLKAAALEKLHYQDYLAFLGIHECSDRLHLYTKIKAALPESSLLFWNNQSKLLEKGVIYQGNVEKLCKVASRFIRLFRGQKVNDLFACSEIAQQQEVLQKNWETFLWKLTFKVGLHPWFTRLFIGDPGLYLTVDNHSTPAKYIYKELHSFLERKLAKESLLLSLLLNGKIEQSLFSPHLTENGIALILPHLHKMRSQDAPIIDFLEGCEENSIDRFSLSDVASYMRFPDYIRLIKAMHRAAKPGARYCIRQFLSSHEIPESLEAYFRREPDLENQLKKDENCFIYRFNIGTIIK